MCGGAEQMRVYLRVRPFSKEELSDNEDQVQWSIYMLLLELVLRFMTNYSNTVLGATNVVKDICH